MKNYMLEINILRVILFPEYSFVTEIKSIKKKKKLKLSYLK